MNPPTGGPSTGATRAGQVRVATACIRSALAVPRSTTRRPTGTISAPPQPCTMRAAVNAHRPWLSPHSTDATVNTAMAVMNTRRGPNRSAAQPLAGMNTASVSR